MLPAAALELGAIFSLDNSVTIQSRANNYATFPRCRRTVQSYVLAALNGDNLPEQLRMRRRAYCADSMAFVDTLMDIGDS